MTDTPITFNTSALQTFGVTALTGLVRIAGTALATHGFITQGIVDSSASAIAQEIAGLIIVGLGQAWAWYREHSKNAKLDDAAAATPVIQTTKGASNA